MVQNANKTGKILIVDDNEDLLRAARMFLKRHFLQVDIEKNPESIPSLLNNEQYDVILLDMNFTKDAISGQEGFDALSKILEIDPNTGRQRYGRALRRLHQLLVENDMSLNTSLE